MDIFDKKNENELSNNDYFHTKKKKLKNQAKIRIIKIIIKIQN